MKGSKWCSDSLISRPQSLVSGIIASQSQDIQYLSATSSLPEQHRHCYQFTWKVLNCYCIAIRRSWQNQSTSVSNGFHPVVVCQDGNWWSPHVVKLVGINPHHAHVWCGWSIVIKSLILWTLNPQICKVSIDQYQENFEFWPVFPRYYIIWGSEWIVLWNSNYIYTWCTIFRNKLQNWDIFYILQKFWSFAEGKGL